MPFRTWFRRLTVCFIFPCLLWGCAGTVNTDRERINPVYQEKIREWQTRIRKEGWSENHIRSILVQFRSLVTYHMEIRDHWDTPKEFEQKGFSGDCEDIAVFMMGTLKRLGYSRAVTILVVRNVFEDHALLRIKMPEGGWRVFDVVAGNIPCIEEGLLRPVVEFDEKGVRWFPSHAETHYDEKKHSPYTAGNTGEAGITDKAPTDSE